jgi:CHAT domain-containing protein
VLQEAGVERLVLVPQGMLFLLPLHACPLNGGERVCDRYTVAYAPAGAVLARLAAGSEATGGDSRRGPQRALLVANPTGDLRHTPSEALAVEQALDRAATTTLWEEVATQARVIEAARGAGLVHFSGHGTYDWRDPERSGLLLRDPRFEHVNWRTGEGLDPFTAAEMREELRLERTRLVTLSACETGLVEVRRGLADEYIGLPSVLLEAGAQAVVASLWAVDDLATALLMRQFYAGWQQGAVPIAEALRRAQNWLRTRTRREVEAALDELDQIWAPLAQQEDDPAMQQRASQQTWEILAARERLAEMDDPPFAHSYWWAAFQAVGDVL